eukprot:2643994-Prymnesium_polylepis.1
MASTSMDGTIAAAVASAAAAAALVTAPPIAPFSCASEMAAAAGWPPAEGGDGAPFLTFSRSTAEYFSMTAARSLTPATTGLPEPVGFWASGSPQAPRAACSSSSLLCTS